MGPRLENRGYLSSRPAGKSQLWQYDTTAPLFQGRPAVIRSPLPAQGAHQPAFAVLALYLPALAVQLHEVVRGITGDQDMPIR